MRARTTTEVIERFTRAFTEHEARRLADLIAEDLGFSKTAGE
ncbi:hypothetical protein ABZ924_11310 [Streptomyces sp. NPDC046876]